MSTENDITDTKVAEPSVLSNRPDGREADWLVGACCFAVVTYVVIQILIVLPFHSPRQGWEPFYLRGASSVPALRNEDDSLARTNSARSISRKNVYSTETTVVSF